MCLKPGLKFPCKCLPGLYEPGGKHRARIVDALPITQSCSLRDEPGHEHCWQSDVDITLPYPFYCFTCERNSEKQWDKDAADAQRSAMILVTRAIGLNTNEKRSDELLQVHHERVRNLNRKIKELIGKYNEEQGKVRDEWWDKVGKLEENSRTKSAHGIRELPKLELPSFDHDKYAAERKRIFDEFLQLYM